MARQSRISVGWGTRWSLLILWVGLPWFTLPQSVRGQSPDAKAPVADATSSRTFEEQGYEALEVRDDPQRDQLLTELARQRLAAQGGASQADFDELIDLMKQTVDPDSWDDNGGTGAVEPFAGGVYVDPEGLLQRIRTKPAVEADRLDQTGLTDHASLRAAAGRDSGNRELRQPANLRKVSLTRLERQLQLKRALGQDIPLDMQYLGGIHRLKYVLVYPDSGDVVIAGPAGPWQLDAEGRPLNVTTAEPVLQLDDFVVLLRNAYSARGRFSCSITPREANLKDTQTFLTSSQAKPLRPGGRDRWLADLRTRVGRQDITIEGLDPATRVARVIVEADYRMKLVGMGLEPGVPGVVSYLDLVGFDANGNLPAMDVLRWWFTLDDKSITTTESRDTYAFSGQGVVLLSENELLTRLGQRVHTGQAEDLNRQFAQSFTAHFNQLSQQYPVYAELRNVFDLALFASLLKSEDLPGQVQWQMSYFGDYSTGRGLKHAVSTAFVPREVETVINHRVMDARHFIAGVSGGVKVDTSEFTSTAAIKSDDSRELSNRHETDSPRDIDKSVWWWD